MRLIDADALYELLDGGYDLDFDEVPETKRELLRMISVQPTIEERKNGKWIKKRGSGLYYCSECDLPSMHNWPYCERCGAKMEESDE